MAKGICADGISVDNKVRSFQITANADDFLIVQQYYDDYKEYWFKQVMDLLDREEFDSEWYSKLLHSIETYQEDKAIRLSRIKGWSMRQKFNRWFYSALRNWISNVKTQAFRVKKRPGIICPICFRIVSKIEERHLRHIRTTKDLPKIFEYNGKVYKTYLTCRKETRMFFGTMKEISDNKQTAKMCTVQWPWYFKNGLSGVMCPYTKRILSIIDDEYLLSLPKKYRYYAKPYTWFEFQQEFPGYMVHSEIMSLDYTGKRHRDKNRIFVDQVGANRRILGATFAPYTRSYEEIKHDNGERSNTPAEYEYAIKAIEKHVSDKVNKEILKYLMIGYDPKDVCEVLGLSRKEYKDRLGELRVNKSLEESLVSIIGE